MKISLITVVYNGEAFLNDCFRSVFEQTYTDVEYIVIDGASTDGTPDIIQAGRERISCLVSEPDKGLYDAINKGMAKATGDIIGILNADDTLAGPTVLERVAHAFIQHQPDAIYGDLHYVHPHSAKIIRKWKSFLAERKDLERGWMPAHPTLYVRKAVIDKYGSYALDLGTAADYELMLRLMYKHQITALYLPFLMVNMRTGGVSNRSVKSLFKALLNDYKAMKRNALPNPLFALFLKKISKLKQFK